MVRMSRIRKGEIIIKYYLIQSTHVKNNNRIHYFIWMIEINTIITELILY